MVNKNRLIKNFNLVNRDPGENLMFNWMDYRINQMQREATLREAEMSRLAKKATHPPKWLTITGLLELTIASLLTSAR
jgi:hypothetical protein